MQEELLAEYISSLQKRIDRIEVLSVAKIIADALAAVFEETSVSELFGGENLA